ncbi:MAG: hypothetical protein FWE45_02945 [Firmicutes bacterium]|nr:hypothetical protein [Bacillota bacterium]
MAFQRKLKRTKYHIPRDGTKLVSSMIELHFTIETNKEIIEDFRHSIDEESSEEDIQHIENTIKHIKFNNRRLSSQLKWLESRHKLVASGLLDFEDEAEEFVYCENTNITDIECSVIDDETYIDEKEEMTKKFEKELLTLEACI